MEQRITFLTLGVKSLRASRNFYEKTLKFKPAKNSGDIIFYSINSRSMVFALYPLKLLAEDAKLAPFKLLKPFKPFKHLKGFTLAHNVKNKFDVDRLLAEIKKRKGRILKPAHDAFWGGRSGYFADPDGNAWEVAWNPFMKVRKGKIKL